MINFNSYLISRVIGDNSDDKYTNEWFSSLLKELCITDKQLLLSNIYKTQNNEYIIFKGEVAYIYEVTEVANKTSKSSSLAVTKDGFVPIFHEITTPLTRNRSARIKGELTKTTDGIYFISDKDIIGFKYNDIISHSIFKEGLQVITYDGVHTFYTKYTKTFEALEKLFFYLNESEDPIIEDKEKEYEVLSNEILLTLGKYKGVRDIPVGIYDLRDISGNHYLEFDGDKYIGIKGLYKNLEINEDSILHFTEGIFVLTKK